MWAASEGQMDAAKLLMSRGADRNLRSNGACAATIARANSQRGLAAAIENPFAHSDGEAEPLLLPPTSDGEAEPLLPPPPPPTLQELLDVRTPLIRAPVSLVGPGAGTLLPSR